MSKEIQCECEICRGEREMRGQVERVLGMEPVPASYAGDSYARGYACALARVRAIFAPKVEQYRVELYDGRWFVFGEAGRTMAEIYTRDDRDAERHAREYADRLNRESEG